MKRIEQHDKAESPIIPETYVYLLAMQSLVAVAEGIYVKTCQSPEVQSPVRGMAESAWPALLAALSYCIGTDLSDGLFAEVLNALQNFTIASGLLTLTTPRNAFLSTLGKYAVPPPVVSAMQTYLEGPLAPRSNSVMGVDALGLSTLGVGGPTISPALSERNLACLGSAVKVARLLAPDLGEAWYDVLEVLQNANFMLAVRKPNLTRRATAQSLVGASPIKGESPFHQGELRSRIFEDLDVESIQAAINGLFDCSKELDNPAFTTFVSALCRLSSEMIGMDANNIIVVDLSETPASPSMTFSSSDGSRRRTSGINISHSIKSGERSFSLTKLRVVMMLNLSRIVSCDPAVGWSIISQHLLAVARHLTAPATIRIQASDALGELLIGAIRVATDSRLQHHIFEVLVRQVDTYPVSNTVATDYDVRSSGYQTLNQILESSGHSLEVGWQTIFGMLNKVCKEPVSQSLSESQIRDPSSNRSSKPFSKGDANLVRIGFPSLTLICTDFLSSLDSDAMRQCIACLGCFGRQREDVNITLAAIGLLWNVSDAVQADLGDLWLFLLTELLELGRDTRIEVRSSAMQTLFRCAELYGNDLSPDTWEDVMWKIIFPLLDTAQGDDSHVLALTSVGAMFNHFLPSITSLPSFARIYDHLLGHLKRGFVNEAKQCCTAALKALELVLLAVDSHNKVLADASLAILDATWLAFIEMSEALESGAPYTQENLIMLVRVASLLHSLVSYSQERLQHLSVILCSIMTYSRSPEYRPDIDVMSPLQCAIADLVETSHSLSPSTVVSDLAEFASLAYIGNTSTKLTYVALSKHSMPKMAEVFGRHSSDQVLYDDGTVESVIGVSSPFDMNVESKLILGKAYAIPIKLKYDCPAPSKYVDDSPLWKTVSGTVQVDAETCHLGHDSIYSNTRYDIGHATEVQSVDIVFTEQPQLRLSDVELERFESIWTQIMAAFGSMLLWDR